MKLPYIQHIGIGLHITDYTIRWVELSRIRDKLAIRYVAAEKVRARNIEESLTALLEGIEPSYKYVTVNIDSNQLKRELVTLPNFDDEEYLNRWLLEQKEQLIPEGLNHDDFITEHHFLGHVEGERLCLFVLARREAILNQLKLIEKVGLKPMAITTGSLQATYGYLFDKIFTTEESWFLNIFERDTSLHLYQNGIQKKIIYLPSADIPLPEIIEEAETYMVAEGQEQDIKSNKVLYTAVSEHYGSIFDYPELDEKKTYAIQKIDPLSQIDSGEYRLTTDYSIAVGMAVRQIYPSLDSINFLDTEYHDEMQEDIHKQDALNTGILFGGTIVLLFAILAAVQFYLESSLNKAKQQVTQLESRIAAVTEAQDKVVNMNKRIEQAQSLVTERTDVAQVMEMIGNAVPEGVWLNEVKIHKPDAEKEIVLYGFAHQDALVAAFMEQLETKKMIENVRLIFSGKVEAGDIYEEAYFQKTTLLQFEIRMRRLLQN